MRDPQGNPRKTEGVRLLGEADIEALRAEVLRIPEDVWDAEDAAKPNRFEALDRTRHIVFRFVDRLRDWRSSHDRPLWAAWRPLVQPVLAQASASYGYTNGVFPRVMLARMAPGGIIQPHRDRNLAAKWPHKIHVPLMTNPGVAFYVDGVRYHFPEGQAVEVNNLAVHAVENAGATDRIHLIFEYYDAAQPEPEWLARELGSA